MDSAPDGTKQYTPAKLTRPSTRGVLPRERLFESLENSREKRLIWVSAPAGSGKTTLAASYLNSRQLPFLWYQLDEGDTDIATFFYYMRLAAQHAFPGDPKPLPLFTPEYLMGIPVFARRFFEQLCEKLTTKAGTRHFTRNGCPAIVFDNYQDVPVSALLHEIINAGVSSLTDGVRVIILSREDPPPTYARLRAMSEMSLLGWEDLRLTAEESGGLLKLKRPNDLDKSTISLLHQTTDGWAAGLVLLVESVAGQNFEFRPHDRFARHVIFDYFAVELFETPPLEAQNFLIETSFLPWMNARMAEALTGSPAAGRILSELSRKNYFITRHSFSELVFQYHPLFREFLQTRAKEMVAPERLLEVKRRAAKVLDANGHGEEAVRLFCETQEWAEAMRVILTHAPGLTAQGRWQTLHAWITSLPPSIRENQPWLLYWMGVCGVPISQDGGMTCFGQAYEQFKTGKDAAGAFLALSGMIDAVCHRLDSFMDLDRLILMMNKLMEEYPEFPSPMIEWHVTNSMLYAFMLRQPGNPEFERWENRGFELARDMADMDLSLRILCALALYHLFSGELAKVRLILESFQKKIDTDKVTPIAVLIQKNIEVFHYWLSADFEKCRSAAEDGLSLAESSGIHLIDPLLLGHSAAGALSTGEISRAEQYLERMLSSLSIRPAKNCESFYHDMMAWKFYLEGQYILASMHADLGLERGAASGQPQLIPLQHLIKAMVMHELKDDVEGSRHLAEFWRICRTITVCQFEFMGFLIEAKIAFDAGNESSGREFLRKAMAIGRQHEYTNGFFWVDSTMVRLCVKALEAGIETDYVQGLIRRRNLIADVPVLHLENWPWPLKIHTLGQFRIFRDGSAVKFSGKVQRKPLALFKALISFGGREVKEELICDALWPEAEGDLAHSSFTTTLYRLRQLLGTEKALHFTEGKLTLDTQFCWVDAFALEQFLDEAAALWEAGPGSLAVQRSARGETARAIELTRKVISMYQGHFLENEEQQAWMTSLRERLRAKYLHGVENLGMYWKVGGKLERAIQCFEKSIEIDDLAEENYQHLMTLYQLLGKPSAAIEVYNRCRSVLEAKLGIEPSSRTEALFAGLR